MNTHSADWEKGPTRSLASVAESLDYGNNHCPVEKFQTSERFRPITATSESAPLGGHGTALSSPRQFLLSVRNVVEFGSPAALEGNVGVVGCVVPRSSGAPLRHRAKPLRGAAGWAGFWYPMIRRSEVMRTLLIPTAPIVEPALYRESAVVRIGLIIPQTPVGQRYS